MLIQWKAIPRLACVPNVAPLARALRVAARSVSGPFAASPVHGRMSLSVEHDGLMSSPPVLRRGLCGLEIGRTVTAEWSGNHLRA